MLGHINPRHSEPLNAFPTSMQFNGAKLSPRLAFPTAQYASDTIKNPFPEHDHPSTTDPGAIYIKTLQTANLSAIRNLWKTYTRGPLLGCGVLGSVYYGMHNTTGEIVGIKYIPFNDHDGKLSSGVFREFSVIRALTESRVVLQ